MNMKEIKLGIIGLSEGNGHPYSWSAIFNGYDPVKMEDCGFPVIPKYLNQRNFPEDSISEATVTHIWTQSKDLSKQIASTCFIENVVDSFTDMIGKVDGILLARDDAENHLKMSRPFLLNGLPIYIDKPLSFNVKEAIEIFEMQKYDGQIFTCSALAYAKEFIPKQSDLNKIGKIIAIEGFTPNRWEKYSVHVIEPILNLIPFRGRLLGHEKNINSKRTIINLHYENINRVSISSLGDKILKPIIKINGERGSMDLVFENTFDAFRSALLAFIFTISKKNNCIDIDKLFEVINIIELGIDK